MEPILIKLVIELAKDKEEHEFYELHEKFRFTPSEVKKIIEFLSAKKVIEHREHVFKLNSKLSNEQLAFIYNAMSSRKLELDKNLIQTMVDKACEITEPYKPNLDIIDKTLKLD
ncbi:UNVERIFIED_ORG: hypothetical protein DFO82_2246 [Idiomarina abyssalis]|uniref:hypothetical protein n=1 Tax=Idiomarina sp. 017G TaxID=2183988 RepID=UPI000E0E0FA6|nr:hypothetical protein [Idiomarina sp. 017G]TDO47421.1 hypothetical protein DEU30_1087 [Idiomarina sp. 017G]